MTLNFISLIASSSPSSANRRTPVSNPPSPLAHTKGATINRDTARRPVEINIDTAYGKRKAQEIAKVFTDENIARAAAGDSDALARVDKFLRFSKSIEKFDAFIPADVKKRIATARHDSRIFDRIKERDKVEDPTDVYWSEVGRGLLDGGRTLIQAPVRIVQRVGTAAWNLVSRPHEAIPAMFKGIWDAGVDIVHVARSRGVGAACLTTLSKAEDTFVGFRSLVREQSAMHSRRRERDDAEKEASNAKEVNQRLKSSGYHRASDSKKAEAAEDERKVAQKNYDDQSERAANQTADSSFAMLSTAFVAGKGLSSAFGGANRTMLGISMAPNSPIMSSLLTKVKNIPAVSNGMGKVAPVVERFKGTTKSSAIKSVVDQNGQMFWDFDRTAVGKTTPLFDRIKKLPQKFTAANVSDNLKTKAIVLEEKASASTGIRRTLLNKSSNLVFKQAEKIENFKSVLSLSGAKETFTSIKNCSGKPLDAAKAKFAESGFGGKIGYGVLTIPAFGLKGIGSLVGLAFGSAHGLVAIGYQGLVLPTWWLVKNLIYKPTIWSARTMPAVPYAAWVNSAEATGALPRGPRNGTAAPYSVALSDSQPTSSPGSETSPNTSKLKSASVAIQPVLKKEFLLGSDSTPDSVRGSEKYLSAVKDAQLKLKAWAKKDGSEHVQTLADQLQDGQYDESMRSLVKEFQKVHGLDTEANVIAVDENDKRGLWIDGIIGPRTSRALNAVSQEEVVLSKDEFIGLTNGRWQRKSGPSAADGNSKVVPAAPKEDSDKANKVSAPTSPLAHVALRSNNGNDKFVYPQYLEVTEVRPDSPLARAGVTSGTKIYEINGAKIQNTQELEDILATWSATNSLGVRNSITIINPLRLKVRRPTDLNFIAPREMVVS